MSKERERDGWNEHVACLAVVVADTPLPWFHQAVLYRGGLVGLSDIPGQVSWSHPGVRLGKGRLNGLINTDGKRNVANKVRDSKPTWRSFARDVVSLPVFFVPIHYGPVDSGSDQCLGAVDEFSCHLSQAVQSGRSTRRHCSRDNHRSSDVRVTWEMTKSRGVKPAMTRARVSLDDPIPP